VSKDKDLTFEAALARLEQVVADMEGGQLALEQSISRFEEGMKLSQFCATQLEAIERRIETLVRQADGTFAWQPAELAKPDPGSDGNRGQ
jgi:exodeoxyribonuclease VII small subunit